MPYSSPRTVQLLANSVCLALIGHLLRPIYEGWVATKAPIDNGGISKAASSTPSSIFSTEVRRDNGGLKHCNFNHECSGYGCPALLRDGRLQNTNGIASTNSGCLQKVFVEATLCSYYISPDQYV